MNTPNFWDDVDNANKINQQLINLKKSISSYNKLNNSISLIKEVIESNDNELINEATNELDELSKEINDLEISSLLNGEYDSLNCYLEIHPGAGGTEACDWASMLYRMYTRFLDDNNYTYEVIDIEQGEEAGLKSVTILVRGFYPYGYLKGETGVHRLVRISPFDSNKRRHTSFASVMVTPEFDNKVDLDIKETDLKIDVYHSSGAGGQSVNTSNSAVRITHVPTGTVVTCQIERSQLKNKEKAMQMLATKLHDEAESKYNSEVGAERKSKVGTGDRSEKIRTYNYPQNRVTDHRINFSIMELDKVMEGDLEPIIEALITEDQRLKLEGN